MSRQPRAYRLDDPNVTAGAVQVTEEPFDAIEAADGVVVPMGEKRRAPWVGILLSALSGLLLLGLGLAVENLIVDLHAPYLLALFKIDICCYPIAAALFKCAVYNTA